MPPTSWVTRPMSPASRDVRDWCCMLPTIVRNCFAPPRPCGFRGAAAAAGSAPRVVVVSSGDPGVFAMASAVFEALEASPQWQGLIIRVLPGVTAMLAAAARAGAPLGHDFCAINLSDNLKPWPVIEKRLRLAAEADFAIAIYNPRSASRPEGFARALELLRDAGCGDRITIFAHAVTTPEERIDALPL